MKGQDIAIVGGGAAGLFAAIWAARMDPKKSIVVLDGAKRIGAKILISGGGRCNVTYYEVDENAFAGSTPAAIRKILRRFDVQQTIDFFRAQGVELKREKTGKLFPVNDRAQTVLNAILNAAESAGVSILTSRRVDTIRRTNDGFLISGNWGQIDAKKIILSTGGKSVPQTGSDGHGYDIARSLGHSCTDQIFPALVPLNLPQSHFLCGLSGISANVEIRVQSTKKSNVKSFQDSMLCTHFGISGPVVLDISRYYIDSLRADPQTKLFINWLPKKSTEEIQTELVQLNRVSISSWIRKHLPERLARELCSYASVEEATPGYRLIRQDRQRFIEAITRMELPVKGDRGFRFAEVTAGGIPLRELNLTTLESRITPGLFICGEICDVDGRIGGFNFQWAWSSGYVAGTSAANLNSQKSAL
jgi:predicted Rossmann fold flavoprotein